MGVFSWKNEKVMARRHMVNHVYQNLRMKNQDYLDMYPNSVPPNKTDKAHPKYLETLTREVMKRMDKDEEKRLWRLKKKHQVVD